MNSSQCRVYMQQRQKYPFFGRDVILSFFDVNIQINKLKFGRVIKKHREQGLESHENTVLQYLHIALTTVATVHTQ
jgi:hypothetical protein